MASSILPLSFTRSYNKVLNSSPSNYPFITYILVSIFQHIFAIQAGALCGGSSNVPIPAALVKL